MDGLNTASQSIVLEYRSNDGRMTCTLSSQSTADNLLTVVPILLSIISVVDWIINGDDEYDDSAVPLLLS